MTPADLTPEMLEFLRERHLATLTTLRPDGSPHVVPVGFTYDEDKHVVRVITFAPSQKAKHAERGGRAWQAIENGRESHPPLAENLHGLGGAFGWVLDTHDGRADLLELRGRVELEQLLGG